MKISFHNLGVMTRFSSLTVCWNWLPHFVTTQRSNPIEKSLPESLLPDTSALPPISPCHTSPASLTSPCMALAQPAVRLRQPLRIVRIHDAGQSTDQVGRMVISGHIADICAELDRMVAHEAHLIYA